MAVLSRLLLAANQTLFRRNGFLGKLLPKNVNQALPSPGSQRCMSHGHQMDITPSRWQWHKTKDWMQFYFFVGAIPALAIITYCNVFIGPATLEPIPEGYVPKQWEYYRHPITRFISKYLALDIQMEYEKFLHRANVVQEMKYINTLKAMFKDYSRQHADYKYWFDDRISAWNIINMRKRMDANEPGSNQG